MAGYHRPEQRQDDIDEDAPGRRAVDPRRFVELDRQVAYPVGEEDENQRQVDQAKDQRQAEETYAKPDAITWMRKGALGNALTGTGPKSIGWTSTD